MKSDNADIVKLLEKLTNIEQEMIEIANACAQYEKVLSDFLKVLEDKTRDAGSAK